MMKVMAIMMILRKRRTRRIAVEINDEIELNVEE